MLDSFAIDRRGLLAHAKLSQKRFHDFVTLLGPGRKPFASSCQFDRTIRRGDYQAVSLQPLDRVVDRGVSHGELLDQVNRSADAVVCNRFGDRLDIILSHFAGMVAAGSFVSFLAQWEAIGRGRIKKRSDSSVS